MLSLHSIKLNLIYLIHKANYSRQDKSKFPETSVWEVLADLIWYFLGQVELFRLADLIDYALNLIF